MKENFIIFGTCVNSNVQCGAAAADRLRRRRPVSLIKSNCGKRRCIDAAAQAASKVELAGPAALLTAGA